MTYDKIIPLAGKAFEAAQALDQLIGKNKKNHGVFSKFVTRQAEFFGDVIQLIDVHLSVTKTPHKLAATLLSVSLYRYGCNFTNLAEIAFLKKDHQATVASATTAIDSLQRSIPIFTQDNDDESTARAKNDLARILNIRAVSLINLEEAEKDIHKSIQYFIGGLNDLKSSLHLKDDPTLQIESSGTIALAVRKALEAYQGFFGDTTTTTAEKSAVLDELTTLMSLCQSIPSTQPTIEIISSSSKLGKKQKGQRHQHAQIALSSTMINLDDFKKMIVSLNCGILNASTDAEKAEKLYRTFLYDGKFSNDPDLESQFIAANLDYLRGNPKTIREFYRKQRIAKILKKIKEQQILAEQASAKQQYVPQPSKATAKPSSQQDYSSTSYTSDASGASSSDKYTPPVKRVKVKTHGVSNPPLTSSIEPTYEAEPTDQAPEIIVLNKNVYGTFHGLVVDVDYKVTLQDVKKLLCFLGCTLDTNQGKGVHQKITAPNGQIWIAPQDWGNRIPDYYRLQLAKFILDDLAIDPDHVMQK
ncbi:MAG: hypothetical protein KF798_06440 [Candidatus Paracaedibacteraceae bacterium]|nr:hypothetical protein [Candidatus Paracaedibacteraceae bacterium]